MKNVFAVLVLLTLSSTLKAGNMKEGQWTEWTLWSDTQKIYYRELCIYHEDKDTWTHKFQAQNRDGTTHQLSFYINDEDPHTVKTTWTLATNEVGEYEWGANTGHFEATSMSLKDDDFDDDDAMSVLTDAAKHVSEMKEAKQHQAEAAQKDIDQQKAKIHELEAAEKSPTP